MGVTEVPVSVGLPGSNSLAAEEPAKALHSVHLRHTSGTWYNQPLGLGHGNGPEW